VAVVVVLLVLGAAFVAWRAPRGEPYRLLTHCGIEGLQHDGRWYARNGGLLSDGQGNPPDGWDNPGQDGRLRTEGDTVVFSDWSGHRETFTLQAGFVPPTCK
jgi:hypothetical protein